MAPPPTLGRVMRCPFRLRCACRASRALARRGVAIWGWAPSGMLDGVLVVAGQLQEIVDPSEQGLAEHQLEHYASGPDDESQDDHGEVFEQDAEREQDDAECG